MVVKKIKEEPKESDYNVLNEVLFKLAYGDVMNLFEAPPKESAFSFFRYFSLINVYPFWCVPFAIFTQVLPSKRVDIRNMKKACLNMYVASEFSEKKEQND